MLNVLSPTLALGSSKIPSEWEHREEPMMRTEVNATVPTSSLLRIKKKDRKARLAWAKALRRDRPIYPRGWFFIFLGVGIGLVGAAFALVEFAIISTVLVIAAILCGVLALFFLTRWLGYYW
ncbi:MAG: hypothetical protein AAF804_14260, partial [Bacteroidota bacterium]